MLTVITPIYNREVLIRDALDSLLRQTSPDWECLVVDDGSTDRSRETVAEYARLDPRIRLFSRPNDREKGPSACRNVGFENAVGDFVFYLDSDDLLEETFCEHVENQFREDAALDFIGVQCVKFLETVDALAGRSFEREPHSVPIRTHFLRRTLDVQSETFCWRKSFLDRFSRHWPEDQRVGEDRVFCYRLLTKECSGAWDAEKIQVLHRVKSLSHGKADQLTPRINIEPALAAERLLTADRLTEIFRLAGELHEENVSLFLDNYLACLRGLLSYRHDALAADCARHAAALAEEFHRTDDLRRIRRYRQMKSLFRFHRIPLVEKSYAAVKRFWKGGRS